MTSTSKADDGTETKHFVRVAQNCSQSLAFVKGIGQFWSCDCIVKETLWSRSEKVDHLAYKYWCVVQGSGIIKMIQNLAQSW